MFWKRLFDILFSLSVMTLASPFFLVCVLLVKLTSKGPVFYAHHRVGKNRRPFACLKFRTMYQNADAKLMPLLASDPALMREWKTFYKLKADPRITPMGKFLRKTSLDELPQFWNVLKGDMSIVGPRPLTEHEVDSYVKDRAVTILSIKPGLTSLWITEGRNELSLEERIHLEEQYVLKRNFFLDLKLILKTLLIMIFPKGAY